MMQFREVSESADEQWNLFLKSHPHGTIWQSDVWAEYERACGRTIRRFVGEDDQKHLRMMAQGSIDRTALGASTWTVQRGPLWDASSEPDDIQSFLQFLHDAAKNDGAMSLFLSPAVWDPLSDLPGRASNRHIVPQATVMIDLRQSEEEILKAMHPKGRYNINIAKRDGVLVEESDDIDAFYELLTKTSERDGFGVKKKAEYKAFLKMPGSFLLLARLETRDLRPENSTSQVPYPISHTPSMPLAGLLGVAWNNQAIYYYGASNYAHRALMAPYLLQWTAIQHTKALGCVSYDFLGIAPPSAPANDPWQGITEFKKKFGGTVVEYPPEREMVLRPIMRSLIRWKRRILG